MSEMVQFDESPTMFCTHPFWFLFWCLLAPVLIGLIVLFFWHLDLRRTRLTISGQRILYRTGVISTRESELRVNDVRDVEVTKTLFQRMIGTGTLALSTAGESGMEIVITGLKQPERVREIINALRS